MKIDDGNNLDGSNDKELNNLTASERRDLEEREKIRYDRIRKREKDIRVKSSALSGGKSREHDRDISEKIALGIPMGRVNSWIKIDCTTE